jgi:hypothetical protein
LAARKKYWYDGNREAIHRRRTGQSTGIIKISADGKTMTDTHSGTLGDQTRYEGEALVYDRR